MENYILKFMNSSSSSQCEFESLGKTYTEGAYMHIHIRTGQYNTEIRKERGRDFKNVARGGGFEDGGRG